MTSTKARLEQMSLEEFAVFLQRFDWWSHMSDDHRVWMAGETAFAELNAFLKTAPADYKTLFESVSARVYK